ncbi:MAG: efflux RND transporter periplasmic adaptor subunit [Planctomycetota bacterium]|nr:efflux RND transporter periplasmic adaptor subunit [Planctomycetota bacterium]
MTDQPEIRKARSVLRRLAWVPGCAALLLAAYIAVRASYHEPEAHAAQEGSGPQTDGRTALVVCRSFEQAVQRVGVLKPVTEMHIFAKVNGTIQELAPQGKVVAKDEVVLRLDPRPHEDARATQEAAIKQQEAEFKTVQQAAAKILNQAKEDVVSYDLKVELETRRLEEVKKGPTPTDRVNAEVNLENSRNLLAAREDELKTLEELAAVGCEPKEEVRKKQLEVVKQRLAVQQADIKYRKIQILDPVTVAEQEFKVREAVKTRDAAKERVALLERNMQRDAERHARHMGRENERLKDLTEKVAKTVHTAPCPGVVVYRRHRWFTFMAGRDVWEGQEILALPDFRTMKVALTVDEARIAFVQEGQDAEITPAGWTGEPFKGKVTLVADKGRDEFEQFTDETTAISGTANRQVFDVEVEVKGQNQSLRPGLRAQVRIILRTIEKALLVPRAALVRDENGDTIVRLGTPGHIERRQVKVKAGNDFDAVVEGVKEGERVWVVEPE